MRFFCCFVRRQDLNDETFHFVRTLVSLGVAILFDAKILYMRSFDNKDVHLVKTLVYLGVAMLFGATIIFHFSCCKTLDV